MSEVCPKFNAEYETILEFLERFQVLNDELLEKAGDNQQKKAAILIKSLPIPVITDLQRRIKPIKLSEATYTLIKEKLIEQFSVKKSIVGATVCFLNRKQQPEEKIENYARILNDLASNCRFSECCRDRMTRDAFIAGLRSPNILSGLLQDCEINEKKSFNECVTKAKLLEQISHDAYDIQPELKYNASVNKLQGQRKYSGNQSENKNDHFKVPSNYICIRCGEKSKHLARNCFALKKKCGKCGIVGHLSRACKSKRQQVHQTDNESTEEEASTFNFCEENKQENSCHYSGNSCNQMTSDSFHNFLG